MLKKLAVAAVALVLMTGALIGINLSMPRLGQSFSMPETLEGMGYRLDPFAQEQDGSVLLHIEDAGRVPDAVLVLAAMRPFEVEIQGETVYRYAGDSPYRRLHVLSLPLDAPQLCIRIVSAQKNMKVMLTSADRAGRLAAFFQGVSCIFIGMYIVMLVFSLILYVHKKTERYLLAQSAAVLTVIVTTVFTSGVFQLGLTEETYAALQKVMDAVRSPILIVCCIALLQPAKPFEWVYRHALPILAVAIALMTALILRNRIIAYNVVDMTLHLFGLFYVLLSPMQAEKPCRWFTGFYIARFALSVYTMLNNRAILPNTELMVYFYIPQLNCILIVFGCMMLVNIRFAEKFRQVDTMSAQLEKLNAELDAKVVARTHDLEVQQQKRHMMMTNIFHDLRSPLFIARGCSDMLRVEGGENEECLATIQSNLEYLSTLTEQLFLIAKLEEKKITFAQVDVDLSALCSMLAREYEIQARQAGIRFRYTAPDGPCIVTGDRFRLKQALENLTGNALKFCDPDNGEVTLALGRKGEQIVLSVTDNGQGIAPEDIPHVFERYYTGHGTDKIRSTGLGLAIAYEIVAAHRGTLEVASIVGQGTTFTLTLPEANP